MAQMSVSKQTTAASDRVWQVLTDIEGWAEAMSSVKAIERLDTGTGFGVGTRWRETRKMFGREATEELEVTSIDEGRSYTVETVNRGVHYRSVMSVEPADGGSLMTMTFEAEQSGLINKLLARTVGKLFMSGMRKALIKDLEDISAAAEPTT